MIIPIPTYGTHFVMTSTPSLLTPSTAHQSPCALDSTCERTIHQYYYRTIHSNSLFFHRTWRHNHINIPNTSVDRMTIYCSLSKIKETLPLYRALLRHKVNSDVCVVGIMGRVSTSSSLPQSFSTCVNDSKSVFPWRHDSSLPERVLERNDLSGPFNPTARDPKFLRKIIAARELNIPIWDALPIPLHKNSWEVTLADNFAVAFSFATEELFRSILQGMMNDCSIISSILYVQY